MSAPDAREFVHKLGQAHGIVYELAERLRAEQNPQLAGMIAHLERAQESLQLVWDAIKD
jgi:hypothetical protein